MVSILAFVIDGALDSEVFDKFQNAIKDTAQIGVWGGHGQILGCFRNMDSMLCSFDMKIDEGSQEAFV